MRLFLMSILALRIVGGGCEPNPGPTGSEDVFTLPGAQILISALAVQDNALVATGSVENTSTTRYSPYWYAEADFYADSTYTLKLGGSAQTFSYVLDPGESTLLNIRFRSTQLDVNLYPNFRVKNLRAYRKRD